MGNFNLVWWGSVNWYEDRELAPSLNLGYQVMKTDLMLILREEKILKSFLHFFDFQTLTGGWGHKSYILGGLGKL